MGGINDDDSGDDDDFPGSAQPVRGFSGDVAGLLISGKTMLPASRTNFQASNKLKLSSHILVMTDASEIEQSLYPSNQQSSSTKKPCLIPGVQIDILMEGKSMDFVENFIEHPAYGCVCYYRFAPELFKGDSHMMTLVHQFAVVVDAHKATAIDSATLYTTTEVGDIIFGQPVRVEPLTAMTFLVQSTTEELLGRSIRVSALADHTGVQGTGVYLAARIDDEGNDLSLYAQSRAPLIYKLEEQFPSVGKSLARPTLSLDELLLLLEGLLEHSWVAVYHYFAPMSQVGVTHLVNDEQLVAQPSKEDISSDFSSQQKLFLPYHTHRCPDGIELATDGRLPVISNDTLQLGRNLAWDGDHYNSEQPTPPHLTSSCCILAWLPLDFSVDRKISRTCAFRARDAGYNGFCHKFEKHEGHQFSILDVDYFVFHCPYIAVVVITHKHQDHIGVLSRVIPTLDSRTPISTSSFMLEIYLFKMFFPSRLEVPNTRRRIIVQPFEVDPRRAAHSCPNCYGSIFNHGSGSTILRIGDLKIEEAHLDGNVFNRKALGDLSKKVALMMSYSTERVTPSAATVDDSMMEHISVTKVRILPTRFGSNIHQLSTNLHLEDKNAVMRGRVDRDSDQEPWTTSAEQPDTAATKPDQPEESASEEDSPVVTQRQKVPPSIKIMSQDERRFTLIISFAFDYCFLICWTIIY